MKEKVCRHIASGKSTGFGTGMCWACAARYRAEAELGGPDHWKGVWAHLQKLLERSRC